MVTIPQDWAKTPTENAIRCWVSTLQHGTCVAPCKDCGIPTESTVGPDGNPGRCRPRAIVARPSPAASVPRRRMDQGGLDRQ